MSLQVSKIEYIENLWNLLSKANTPVSPTVAFEPFYFIFILKQRVSSVSDTDMCSRAYWHHYVTILVKWSVSVLILIVSFSFLEPHSLPAIGPARPGLSLAGQTAGLAGWRVLSFRNLHSAHSERILITGQSGESAHSPKWRYRRARAQI